MGEWKPKMAREREKALQDDSNESKHGMVERRGQDSPPCWVWARPPRWAAQHCLIAFSPPQLPVLSPGFTNTPLKSGQPMFSSPHTYRPGPDTGLRPGPTPPTEHLFMPGMPHSTVDLAGVLGRKNRGGWQLCRGPPPPAVESTRESTLQRQSPLIWWSGQLSGYTETPVFGPHSQTVFLPLCANNLDILDLTRIRRGSTVYIVVCFSSAECWCRHPSSSGDSPYPSSVPHLILSFGFEGQAAQDRTSPPKQSEKFPPGQHQEVL
ncbi:hypothetical protein Q8A73_010964 [Channa argus]|nr:hypothetical protein Q8A73_010964 [Channa argus]